MSRGNEQKDVFKKRAIQFHQKRGLMKNNIMPILLAILLIIMTVPQKALAVDATGNGQWLSLGVPKVFHASTAGGIVYITGSTGKCGGIAPDYFTIDMSAPHFKELWSLLLTAATTNKNLDCIVDSGCGTNLVSVAYCAVYLN